MTLLCETEDSLEIHLRRALGETYKGTSRGRLLRLQWKNMHTRFPGRHESGKENLMASYSYC